MSMSMFNGSSNVIIQGGTFIIAGNISSDFLKEMGVNISENSTIESNLKCGSNPNFCSSCGRGLATNQFPHSAVNFGTSVYASGQVPEHSPYPLPTPSVTSEVKSWETVGASRRNAKPDDDSHASPLHSKCLAISQSHNMVRTRSRSSFEIVIQLILSLIILSLVNRHVFSLPRQSVHIPILNHFFPFSNPTISLVHYFPGTPIFYQICGSLLKLCRCRITFGQHVAGLLSLSCFFQSLDCVVAGLIKASQ